MVCHTLDILHQAHRILEHPLIDSLMDKTAATAGVYIGHQISIVDVTSGQHRGVAQAAAKPKTTADSAQRRTYARIKRCRSPAQLHRARAQPALTDGKLLFGLPTEFLDDAE